MLIATWNVNSIRTRLPQVIDWINEFNPEVLCLQETKVEDSLFPLEAFESNGYQVSFSGQKSYNGVAIINKGQIKDIRIGFIGELSNDKEAISLSDQKRLISGLFDGVRIVNVYVPNGSNLSSEKYLYKLKWLNCLKRYLEAQASRGEPVCILGDFNIAPEDKDIHTPERLKGSLMASEKERTALKNVLGGNFEDVFRVFEQETGHWSWWDYRTHAWERNKGWRIDQIYLSQELLINAKNCQIHKKVRGNLQPSDHAPVITEINWPPVSFDNDIDDYPLEL